MNKVKAFSGKPSRVSVDIEIFQRYLVGSVIDVTMAAAAVAGEGAGYSVGSGDILVVITYSEDI